MSAFRIAVRYAKSLLELAEEKGTLSAVHADVLLLDTAFSASRELQLFLKSPIIPADKKHTILTMIFGGKISDITSMFVSLLVRKGRERYLHDIAVAFIKEYNKRNSITPLVISTAVKLNDDVVKKLVEALNKKEQLGSVELVEEVKPEILGGFILKYGDRQIDASAQRKLKELRDVIDDDSYIKKY